MHTLTECPGGHSVLHWGLKLSSKNLVGKYKQNWTRQGQLIFHGGANQESSEYLPAVMEEIFETNSSFHVKYCTTGKTISIFQQLFYFQ